MTSPKLIKNKNTGRYIVLDGGKMSLSFTNNLQPQNNQRISKSTSQLTFK